MRAIALAFAFTVVAGSALAAGCNWSNSVAETTKAPTVTTAQTPVPAEIKTGS